MKSRITILTLVLSSLFFSNSVFADTLTDPETGLSVALPLGWEFDEPVVELFYFVNQRDPRINGGVGFDATGKNGERTARNHAEKRIAEMKEYEPGSLISEIKNTRLAGLEAVSFIATMQEKKMLYIFARKEDQILQLLLIAPPDQFEAALGDFEIIRENIHF